MALAEQTGEHEGHVVAENSDGAGRFVILCDHASNNIPPRFAGLGLTDGQRNGHIAWDPGALAVSRRLSERLDAPLLWPNVSRLIVDCNRAHDAPDLITELGEGQEIPGNRDLPPDERRARIDEFHEPYHRAVDACLDARLAAGRGCALVAVHSFTPVFHGVERPWPIGIIFDRDRSLADHVIDGLRAEATLNVGVNQPYSPADRVYTTLSRHGEARGLPAVMIEIRNDEIADAPGQRAWADRLADILDRAPLERRADA